MREEEYHEINKQLTEIVRRPYPLPQDEDNVRVIAKKLIQELGYKSKDLSVVLTGVLPKSKVEMMSRWLNNKRNTPFKRYVIIVIANELLRWMEAKSDE